MAGLLSQDDVEKAQEALRILRSIPFPISSSAAHGPSTSSGETELCMYTVHAYSHLHSRAQSCVQISRHILFV